MDHTDSKSAFAKGMADRSERHVIEYNDADDRSVYPSTPDQLAYPKYDMKPNEAYFGAKIKNPSSDDRMSVGAQGRSFANA